LSSSLSTYASVLIFETGSDYVRHFFYDQAGQLIGEYRDNPDGTYAYVDYIWLNGAPLVQEERSFNSSDVLTGGKTTWLHVDHLNTPRVGTNDTQTIVWRWDSDPFGVGAADSDPDNDSTDHVVLLRFPGQYEDEESGHYYNYFRDYDPVTGRYTTADPIGLKGGMNRYAYAGSSPTRYVDPLGLVTFSFGGSGSFQAGAAGASIDGSVGMDTAGNICFQATVCGRIGPGESAGVGLEVEVGSGEFCEGDQLTGGIFAEAGLGPFGGAEVNAGANDIQGSVELRGGLGGGAAGGSQICTTRTYCL
jgi:RHS repeat-associated protein